MVEYTVISEGGQAIFRNSNGRVDFQGPQYRNYLITIDQNGFISGSDLGYHGTNVARFYLFNPWRFPLIVDWHDNGTTEQYIGNECSSIWLQVPWDLDENFMTINIDPESTIKTYSGTSYAVSLEATGDEIRFRTPEGEEIIPKGDVSLNIDKAGDVTIESITTTSVANLITVNSPYSVPYELYTYLDQSYGPMDYCLSGSLGTTPPFPQEFSRLELLVFVPELNPCEDQPCGGQCSGPCPEGQTCQITNGIYKCVASNGCTNCGGDCFGPCPTGQQCMEQEGGTFICVSNECNGICGGVCPGTCPEGETCTKDANGVYHCVATGEENNATPWYKSAWFIALMVILSLIIVALILYFVLKPKPKKMFPIPAKITPQAEHIPMTTKLP